MSESVPRIRHIETSEDLLLSGAAAIAPEALPWLAALFPRRWPTTLPQDGF